MDGTPTLLLANGKLGWASLHLIDSYEFDILKCAPVIHDVPCFLGCLFSQISLHFIILHVCKQYAFWQAMAMSPTRRVSALQNVLGIFVQLCCDLKILTFHTGCFFAQIKI